MTPLDGRISTLPVAPSGINALDLFESSKYIGPSTYATFSYKAQDILDFIGVGSGTADYIAMFDGSKVIDGPLHIATTGDGDFLVIEAGRKFSSDPGESYLSFAASGNEIIGNTKPDGTGGGFAITDTVATFGAPNGAYLTNATTSRIVHGTEFKLWAPYQELSTDSGALNESALILDSQFAEIFSSFGSLMMDATATVLNHGSSLLLDTSNGTVEVGATTSAAVLIGNASQNTLITINGQIQNYATMQMTSLSADTVPYLNASKIFVSSSVTPTELGYLSGVTSSLQTQLDNINTVISEWRTLRECQALLTSVNVVASDVFWMTSQGNAGPRQNVANGTPPSFIYIKASDYPGINGLTAKLRIKVSVFSVNDVAPGITFTVGLYPCSSPTSGTTGGGGLRAYASGTVVAGSNGLSITTPAADSLNFDQYSSAFSIPADGLYAIGILSSGAIAANSANHVIADLQIHYE